MIETKVVKWSNDEHDREAFEDVTFLPEGTGVLISEAHDQLDVDAGYGLYTSEEDVLVYIDVVVDNERLEEEWKEKGLLHRIEVLRRKKEARTGEPTSMSSLIWDMIDDVLDLWEEDEEQRERYPEEYEEGD